MSSPTCRAAYASTADVSARADAARRNKGAEYEYHRVSGRSQGIYFADDLCQIASIVGN